MTEKVVLQGYVGFNNLNNPRIDKKFYKKKKEIELISPSLQTSLSFGNNPSKEAIDWLNQKAKKINGKEVIFINNFSKYKIKYYYSFKKQKLLHFEGILKKNQTIILSLRSFDKEGRLTFGLESLAAKDKLEFVQEKKNDFEGEKL